MWYVLYFNLRLKEKKESKSGFRALILPLLSHYRFVQVIPKINNFGFSSYINNNKIIWYDTQNLYLKWYVYITLISNKQK